MPSYKNTLLRRHGDQVIKYVNGFYKSLGRMDDTMNLGGIKISSAEIEHVLNKLPEVYETAAVASAPKDGGPSSLIIYAVIKQDVNLIIINWTEKQIADLKLNMQNALREHLNPLFKIEKVEIVDSLMRTASNKIIRKII
jgi:acetyl-CoA synthetase